MADLDLPDPIQKKEVTVKLTYWDCGAFHCDIRHKTHLAAAVCPPRKAKWARTIVRKSYQWEYHTWALVNFLRETHKVKADEIGLLLGVSGPVVGGWLRKHRRREKWKAEHGK